LVGWKDAGVAQRLVGDRGTEALDCTVLVVDTDFTVLHGFAQALRQAGYLVFEASSYEDGKRLWREITPAVLIVDIRLGEFNGLQLLMRARAGRPDLKGIITCPVADHVLEAETQRFGGTFLVKPLAPWQIVEAVTNATGPNAVAPEPVTAPLGLEQRRVEFRQAEAPALWRDRRLAQQGEATAKADQPLARPRRQDDRRKHETPDFMPERRVAERRRPVR
jgi:DNA-binding NtrC family response regulator